MKLLLSVLLLATAAGPLAFAQEAPNAPQILNLPQAPVFGPFGSPTGQNAPQILNPPQAPVFGPFGSPTGQTGCPVVLTSARLNWPASYLQVTSAEKVTEPNLALGFQNKSGKGIRSVTITAEFLGKKNLYQLDASAFDLRLTFSRVDEANQAEEQLREIRVPEKMYAYGVTRVSLDQVMFADGTFWTSWGQGSNCSLNVKGTAERVAK